ncbi:MAG TPA: hypothetical protein VH208_01890 [Myxococcaceae bacterium]|nr:hypothetical protein [Myxococcaceae bacterium]
MLGWSGVAWAGAGWELGGRVGMEQIYLGGDGSPSDLRGFVFALQPAARVSRHFALGLSLEASLYPRRSDRVDSGPLASSAAAFLEAGAQTHPGEPCSASLALSAGYRRLWLPLDAGGTDAFWAIEAFRLQGGPSFRAGDRVRIEILLGGGFGWFFAARGARECAITAACPDSLYGSTTQSSVHFTLDLSVAVRG